MKNPEENLEESALQRWSRRKHESAEITDVDEPEIAVELAAEPEPEKPALTDADMPPIESLDENSDYAGFLSPEVSEELRKLALRKLFHLPSFNVRDGMDDYDGDYTEFAALGNLVTADMKHIAEVEAKRKLEQLAALDSDAAIEDASEDIDPDDELILAATEDEVEGISDDSEVDEPESKET